MIFRTISLICYFIVSISSLIMGIIYLLSKKFMNYHAQVIGKKWEDIDEKFKIIILALLKLGGIGFFITGISIIGIIDILFNNLTGIVLSTIIGLFFWISSFIITTWVKNKTNANTPTIPSLINVVLIIIGFVFFLFSIL